MDGGWAVDEWWMVKGGGGGAGGYCGIVTEAQVTSEGRKEMVGPLVSQ